MTKIFMGPEPSPLEVMVSLESERLVEAVAETQPEVKPWLEPRLHVGRGLFYAAALDDYVDYTRQHLLFDKMLDQAKARNRVKAELEEQGPMERKPLFTTRANNADVGYVFRLDQRRLTLAMGLAILHETKLRKVLLDSATHYFQVQDSRGTVRPVLPVRVSGLRGHSVATRQDGSDVAVFDEE